MIEFYKEIARYQADIMVKATGKMIEYRAVVLEGPSEGSFHIQHSHTLRPSEQANFWHSNTYTRADSPEEAETLVRSWAEMLSKAVEVKPWTHVV